MTDRSNVSSQMFVKMIFSNSKLKKARLYIRPRSAYADITEKVSCIAYELTIHTPLRHRYKREQRRRRSSAQMVPQIGGIYETP